jgi:hypothetical protein
VTVARDTILALRRSVGSGGPNFTADVAARAWNDALVAVVVRLELDSEENARAALKRMVDAERARHEAYLDELNARAREPASTPEHAAGDSRKRRRGV